MEELDEFEVLWPEPETCHMHEPPPPPLQSPSAQAAQPSDAPAARSRPVDVPGPKAARSWRRNVHGPREDSGDHGDDGSNGSAIVPPHLLLSAGRRREEEEAEAAAWTLRAFVGPPCKRARERDLRHLRDSVLRLTGFIEG